MKKEFIDIFNKYILRDGSGLLLDYLNNSDFFVAPASSKFHSSFEGGLCEHSLNVYKRFLKNIQLEYGDGYEKIISNESIAIIGLLHDVCKINYFKKDFRNAKVGNVWVKEPMYTIDEELPYGHGEKSVYIISGFLKLSREEAMAINWHMGAFDYRIKGGSYSLNDAFYKFPTTFIFHISDMQATFLDEKK